MELIDSQYLVQNGGEVFRWVVRNVPNGIRQILEKTQTSIEQIHWFIPHSANLRLIEPICKKLAYPIEKNLYSLVNFGNTSAATIPLALDLGIREGKVNNGDRVLMYGIGSGLVHAGQLLEINLDKLVKDPTPL
ncbi:3-oxoacyl-[acyl-carrier-protein] synthase III C-terminal domain-containing protein [Roseburia sp. 1XD42-34]|nr:3-oxoacyl-[acyl-carrier-protein] synthase III C-terminal domain-containing protein [Roseburia sp. 1XD42-34]